MRFRARVIWFLLIAAILGSLAAQARVVRVEITSRADLQDGKPFGNAGPYEKIVGRVYFAVDPANLHNRQIVDLDKAPRNAHGEVEFSADLYLLKPKDIIKGNQAVLFEVSNRGGRGILSLVNGREGEYGDGFLMRQGYTIAWGGWEFYFSRQCCVRFPIAAGAEFFRSSMDAKANMAMAFSCAKDTQSPGWAGSLISPARASACGFLHLLLMIPAEKKFMDW